jgi:hypothetical protein
MADNIKIKKIKYSESAGKIMIDYERIRGINCDELQLTSDEAAAPEFYEALEKLTGPVCTLLELKEKDFKSRIIPYGVTFHYDKNDVMGAVISAKLSLPDAGTEVVLNTPMRKCQPDDDAGGLFFSESMTKFLWALEGEARKYISGKRAQTTLFDEVGNVADAEETAAADPDMMDDGFPLPPPAPAAGQAQVIDFPQSAAH